MLSFYSLNSIKAELKPEMIIKIVWCNLCLSAYVDVHGCMCVFVNGKNNNINIPCNSSQAVR